MKSYETTVLPLYAGILEDAYTRWPDVRKSAERDMFRLSKTIKDRGAECVTLLFPSVRHWFDKSLDAGRLLDEPRIPQGMRVYRGRPLLFAGILAKIFDDDGMLRDIVDPWAVLCYRTLLSVCGKLEVPPSEATLHRSIKEFCSVEDDIAEENPGYPWGHSGPNEPPRSLGAETSPTWFPYGKQVTRVSSVLWDTATRPGLPWDTFRQLCRRVVSELGGLDLYGLEPKHGPGAVSERGVVDKYDFRFWPENMDRVFPMIGTVAAVFCLHRTRQIGNIPRG